VRFLQCNTFPDSYLDRFYADRPGLAEQSFDEQIAALIADGFGASHIRAPYLAKLGYECLFVISNCVPAQTRWALENGFEPPKTREEMTLLALNQFLRFNPDILYLTDTLSWDSSYLRALPRRPRIVMGWNAAPIPDFIDWSEYDLILSADEGCLKVILDRGAKASRFFYPHLPPFVARTVADQPKLWDVVFSGQVSVLHQDRTELLRQVVKAPLGPRGGFSLGLYLAHYAPHTLPAGFCMHNQGAVWGMPMHRAIKSARIMLNVHIDMAAKKSLNMRTFETIGTGSFLLTEASEVLPDFFEPGKEVETYRSVGEMLDKIYYYLEHDAEREEIARRGFERLEREHGAEQGAKALDEIIRGLLG
jgi:hypothetical protein